MYRIYLIRHGNSSKGYVGITGGFFGRRICRHVWEARRGKGTPESIQAAIRDFGENAFSAGVLEHVLDPSAAIAREKDLINELNTLYPNGYNTTKGGSRKMSCSDVISDIAVPFNVVDDDFTKEVERLVIEFERSGFHSLTELVTYYEDASLFAREVAERRGITDKVFPGYTHVSVNLADLVNRRLLDNT